MWPFFKVINLLYVLISSYAWFGSVLPLNIVPIGVSMLMIICFALGNFNLKVTPRFYVILGVLILFTIFTLLNNSVVTATLAFISYAPAALIFLLDKRHSTDLLRFVTKWMCILLGISLGWYVLSMFVPLPHTTFIQPNNKFYLPFDNYFFFIQSPIYETDIDGVSRFGSFFLEPGHMSMICTLLLFANRYQMRKYPLLWIPVACVLISYSLTGYIILLVSIALLKMKNIIYMILTVILLSGAMIFVTDIWNGGDNAVNVLILERLELDEKKGIKGNNRTVDKTDYFYRQSLRDGLIWTGIQDNERAQQKIIGAGYKIYFLRYGVISAIFVFTLYLLFIKPRANKRFAYSFLLLIVLLFLQRAYPMWFSWLFFYIIGIAAMVDEPFFDSTTMRKIQMKKLKKRKKKNPQSVASIPSVTSYSE